MGKFTAKAVTVKEVRATGLRIVFYDKKTIYIHDSKNGWTVFHRWFAPSGSYANGWSQFRHLLWYEKKLTYAHCYRLAFRYDISSQRAYKAPDLAGATVQERIFEEYEDEVTRWRRKIKIKERSLNVGEKR